MYNSQLLLHITSSTEILLDQPTRKKHLFDNFVANKYYI